MKAPNFNLDKTEMPLVAVKNIHFENFKAFKDEHFDFTDNGKPKKFCCLFGPNGTGKTTILETLQIIFSKFDSYEKERLKILLGKSVRHIDGNQNGIYGDDNFLVTADIHTSIGDYQIQLDKTGFLKDHPEEIKNVLKRIYYFARYDQELHQFQLDRDKWDIFKKIIESVMGYVIEENKNIFSIASEDPVQAELLERYVLNFNVCKPNEIISCRECSAGERKVIKSFSTLLNKEYFPQILLIDNIEMHVELGRHINLINSIKESFPDAQIFATTHSYYLKKFGDRSDMYDLRTIKTEGLMKSQPWRIYLQDEIQEYILQLESLLAKKHNVSSDIIEGYSLLKRLKKDADAKKLTKNAITFIHKVVGLSVKDLVRYYNG